MKKLALIPTLLFVLVMTMGASMAYYYIDASQITSGTLAAARMSQANIESLIGDVSWAPNVTGGQFSTNRLPDDISITSSVTVGTQLKGAYVTPLLTQNTVASIKMLSAPSVLLGCVASTGTDYDLGLNGNNATLTAFAGTEQTIVGMGYTYNLGATNTTKALTVADAANLSFGTSAFSLVVWINPASSHTGRIIGKHKATTGEYFLDTFATSNEVRFYCLDSNSNDAIFADSSGLGSVLGGPITPGTWTMITATTSGGLSANMKIYANATVSPAYDLVDQAGYVQMRDGADALRVGLSANDGVPFKGSVGFSAVFPVELSANQIRNIYETTRRLYNQ